ncbi:MAG: protein TolR [Xanthomonadaceae bacterium]|nr:protein TolR [Xanthomonadaceae bacterium]
MARAGKRRMMSDINVVPYIDVMLVLLIIFMITAPLLTQGVTIDLPQAEAEPLPPDPDRTPVVLTVNAAGEMFLNIAEDPEAPLERAVIGATVRAVLRHRPGTPVVVRGDRAAEYRHIISGLVLLQAAGVPNVGLMTEPAEEPAPRRGN